MPRVATMFCDRTSAGRRLTGAVADLPLTAPIVLGLPRGGVPVAVPVAEALHAPLDVFVVRKIGAPHQRELAIGAIAEGGDLVVDRDALSLCGLSADGLASLVNAERQELDRRVQAYRGDRPLPDLAGRDVVVVDDGLATGATAEAAVRALRRLGPRRIVVAVPVCSGQAAERLRAVADEVVCVDEPSPFLAVGYFYERFDQTSDGEVVSLLTRARSA